MLPVALGGLLTAAIICEQTAIPQVRFLYIIDYAYVIFLPLSLKESAIDSKKIKTCGRKRRISNLMLAKMAVLAYSKTTSCSMTFDPGVVGHNYSFKDMRLTFINV